MSTKPYTSLIGSFMYLEVCTHSDIAFALSVLSRFLIDLEKRHWETTKYTPRYLKATRSMELVDRQKELQLVSYTDSDLAEDEGTRKSTSGLLVYWLEFLCLDKRDFNIVLPSHERMLFGLQDWLQRLDVME